MEPTAIPPRRKLLVDLGSIVEIATEDEAYLDEEYARSGYFDTETGAVHILYRDALLCADGELEPDQLEEWSAQDVELAGRILEASEERYVLIDRWPSSETFAVMEAFAEGASDPRVRNRLLGSLRGRKPFRSFKDALCEWPELREAWFSFKEHQLRDRARTWVLNFGIEAIDASEYQPPPAPERW